MESARPPMKNVLIFPAGTEIGLEIHSALKSCKNIKLHAAGQNISNHAQLLFDEFHTLPSVHDKGFNDAFIELVKRLGIHYVFPAHDDAIVKLSSMREQLPATLIAPSNEICEITRSKSATYHRLKGIIPTPAVHSKDTRTWNYPLLVKPDKGQGSLAINLVKDSNELEHALKNTPEPIICEYLPGEEYTVDCFSDREKGLLFSGARIRRRMRNGISVNTETADIPEAKTYAQAIGAELGIHGAWFFQIKRSADGVLKLLEVAPRIAGSMALHRVIGVNFPLLSIHEADRANLSINAIKGPVTLDRALKNRYRHRIEYQHLYIDLDDTIIINDMINIDAMRLIYQSINQNIRITLITRHAKNLEETLRRHRLTGLFDEILHIKDGSPKSQKINPQGAIFVDDSHRERNEVSERLGIPAFDVSMIELITDGQTESKHRKEQQ